MQVGIVSFFLLAALCAMCAQYIILGTIFACANGKGICHTAVRWIFVQELTADLLRLFRLL